MTGSREGASSHPLIDALLELERIVQKMMARDREERFQNAQEVAEALTRFAGIPPMVEFSYNCPVCGAVYRGKDHPAGTSAKCKDCKSTFSVVPNEISTEGSFDEFVDDLLRGESAKTDSKSRETNRGKRTSRRSKRKTDH